ncbi:hypothetical protein [Bacillus sp. UNC438CL73TsuS30]|uniref:hypothetical protein n=1 Tax=Bacillus sp. UNC438CL73TsuS30 TaxID=1340434 RepID=UPI000478A92D|nr:hypothetical protein [Bacillus sp. UNC438CL73TsuS30]
MHKKDKVINLKEYKKMKKSKKNTELFLILPVFLTVLVALFTSFFVTLSGDLHIQTFTETHANWRR